MNLYPVFRSTLFADTVKTLLSIFITNIYMDECKSTRHYQKCLYPEKEEFSELYLPDFLLSLGPVDYGTKV